MWDFTIILPERGLHMKRMHNAKVQIIVILKEDDTGNSMETSWTVSD